MDVLQNVFYVLGIIYMVLGIVILLVIVVTLLYIKRKITELHEEVMKRIEGVTAVTSKAAAIAGGIGAFVAEKTKHAKEKN